LNGLEDEEEARQLMETETNQSQNMRFGAIVSPIPGHRIVSGVADYWEDMEVDDERFIIHSDECKSWHGEVVEDDWCVTLVSLRSLPSKIDHSKNDDSVWDFETPWRCTLYSPK
jgi:hypothetical protein